MDWTACIICQQTTPENVSCPQTRRNYDSLTVFNDFLMNVKEFMKLDALPVNLQYGAEWTAETFVRNEAKWHRSCHQKFNKSKLERQVEKKRKHDTQNEEQGTRRSKRQSTNVDVKRVCIFCEAITACKLHNFATFCADHSLRQMATDMQDEQLLAKMAGGDLVALEAKYHLGCMTQYRNSHRAHQRQATNHSSVEVDMVKARAFVELVSYVEFAVEDGIYIFKLSELHTLYHCRVQDLGQDISINKTRLKNRLLEHFADSGVQEQSDGKNVVLIFPEGMQKLLRDALLERNYESEALLFAKVAKICREEMFTEEPITFSGSFPSNCQKILPSTNLLASMILYGPNLKSDVVDTRACMTISQMFLHNSKKRYKEDFNQQL